MGTEKNAELVRRGYEAFSSGDVLRLRESFADNAVWHAAGSGALAGRKQGRDAILAYFVELATRSNGTFRVTIQEIMSGENSTVVLQHEQAQRKGRTLSRDGALTYEVTDGRITEGREFFSDTAQGDAFWA
jgi:uncharacterized protein